MALQEAAFKRNQESAILFMQQEHANTLKGLHEEIRKLQKKCTDLTFQLNMQGLGLEDTVPNAQLEELQSELEECKLKQTNIEKDMELKQHAIKELELQQKKQKMKQMEESRKKNQELEKLKAELESKSNQIAYLTTELHKFKRLHADGHHSASKNVQQETQLIPLPPASQHPSRSNRGALGRLGKLSVDQEELEKRGLRVSSGKSNSSSRSDSPIEMAKQILRVDDQDGEMHIKEAVRYPLPPIKAFTAKEGLSKQNQRLLVRKVVPPPHPLAVKHRRPNFQAQELHTLAVGQVSGSEATKWPQAQGSHSHEYN